MIDQNFDNKIILVKKPKGITSFDVIRVLRRKTGIQKMGHAGTLDPLAQGLLIVATGKATKQLAHYLKLDKVYLMDVLLGIETATGDLEGEMIAEKAISSLDKKEIKKVLKEMEGVVVLKVPAYSAVRIKGKKLYQMAREGKKVEPPTRQFRIYSLKLKKIFKQESGLVVQIEMKCASGVYARSVAVEIGRRIGAPATLSNLIRLKIGKYSLGKAKALEDF